MPFIQKLLANFWQNTGNVTLFSVLGGLVGFSFLFLFVWRQPACTRIKITGLADGSVIKNPPANAGDAGLIPGLGGFLGATKPVCATTTQVHGQQLRKPTRLKPVLQKTKEAPATRRPCTSIKSSPCSPQPEKACAKQSKTQYSQKLINK